MSDVIKFKAPYIVRVIAIFFFILSPLTIFLMVSLINFEINKNIIVYGDLKDNVIIIDNESSIKYQNTNMVTLNDEAYSLDSINILETHVRIYLNTAKKIPNSKVTIQLRITEKATIMNLLFH